MIQARCFGKIKKDFSSFKAKLAKAVVKAQLPLFVLEGHPAFMPKALGYCANHVDEKSWYWKVGHKWAASTPRDGDDRDAASGLQRPFTDRRVGFRRLRSVRPVSCLISLDWCVLTRMCLFLASTLYSVGRCGVVVGERRRRPVRANAQQFRASSFGPVRLG